MLEVDSNDLVNETKENLSSFISDTLVEKQKEYETYLTDFNSNIKQIASITQKLEELQAMSGEQL